MSSVEGEGGNFIKFLGTAGARFVTIAQLRASGGIWVSYQGTNILIDPGPGSLVRCLAGAPKLDPAALDAIIVTHKHIDHSNDINIMTEAMTAGGSKSRGIVFVPSDMLAENSVFVEHFRRLPQAVVPLGEGKEYRVGAVAFTTPVKLAHTVEAYGLKFRFGDRTVSLIADTGYFEGLCAAYRADTIIFNTVFLEPLEGVDHLSVREAAGMIATLRPRRAVLTHFGRDLIKRQPAELAQKIAQETGVEVIAAEDGMMLKL